MIIASHGKTGGGIKDQTIDWNLCADGWEGCRSDRHWYVEASCLSGFQALAYQEFINLFVILPFVILRVLSHGGISFMCRHSVIVKSCFLSFHHYHLNFILPKLSSLFPPAGFNGADKLQRLLWWAHGFGSVSVSFDIFPKTALDALSSVIKKHDFMLKGTDWWLCGFHNLFVGWLQ